MKECIQCGAVIGDLDKHCRYCGKYLGDDTANAGENPEMAGEQQSYQPPRYPDPPPIYDEPQGYQQPPQGGYAPPPGYQNPPQGYAPPPGYQNPPQGYAPPPYNQPPQGYNPNAPMNYNYYYYTNRSKTAAGLFGILLGAFGVHKFYLGNIGMGVLYLLFCWTGIPSIAGIIEGIIYLTMEDGAFREKYCKVYR